MYPYTLPSGRACVLREMTGAEEELLTKTRMPAVLVELAFISNSQEEAWLKERTMRQQFAQAIADAIDDVWRKKGA